MKAVRNLLIYIFSTYLLVMFGFNAAQDFWCSTLVKGVIYGSYSVSEMFPKNFTNCTWTLENPDPTKYSIYLKFSNWVLGTGFPECPLLWSVRLDLWRRLL